MLPLYILAFRKRLSLFTGVFLSFTLFIDFNSVLFRQYLVWPAATLALAASCWMESRYTSASCSGVDSDGGKGKDNIIGKHLNT